MDNQALINNNTLPKTPAGQREFGVTECLLCDDLRSEQLLRP